MKSNNSSKKKFIKKQNKQSNPKDENIILNYNIIDMDGFQVYSPNLPIEKEKDKLGNVIDPFEMKNSNDYIISWKTLEEIEESKDEKELLDDFWDNIMKLSKHNILDYSLINKLVRFLVNDTEIQRFLFLIFNLIDNSLDDYIKNEKNFLLVKNNLIFFMFVVINMKNNEKFCCIFAKEKIEFLTMTIDKIQKIKNDKVKTYFNNILYELFSNEYIQLGLNLLISKDVDNNNIIILNEEDNLNNNNIILNNDNPKINKTLNNFCQNFKKDEIKDDLKEEKYSKVVESLFDFDSENFLNYKQNLELDYNELFWDQIELVKNIILIIFSKEKYQYLKDDDIYYEYEFLDKLIKKNIAETKEIHEDKHRNLFRRDNISTNIIKYIFFLFGNSMVINGLVKPINTIINILGLNNEFEIISFEGKTLSTERNIAKDEFNILFEKILDKLNENIPFILRILLKIMYDNVKNEYPNLANGDYSPISSLLFFCYLSNPRIQKIFEIYPEKYLLIKSVYRLLYNASFNIKFKENDNLYIFNDEIEGYHQKIKEFYENNVINIELNEENKKYLKNLFDEIGVECPQFIFYLSCDYIYDL